MTVRDARYAVPGSVQVCPQLLHVAGLSVIQRKRESNEKPINVELLGFKRSQPTDDENEAGIHVLQQHRATAAVSDINGKDRCGLEFFRGPQILAIQFPAGTDQALSFHLDSTASTEGSRHFVACREEVHLLEPMAVRTWLQETT